MRQIQVALAPFLRGKEKRRVTKNENTASGPIGYRAVEGKAARYCEAADAILGDDWPGNGVRAHLDDRARVLYHRLPIDPSCDMRAHPLGRSTLIE